MSGPETLQEWAAIYLLQQTKPPDFKSGNLNGLVETCKKIVESLPRHLKDELRLMPKVRVKHSIFGPRATVDYCGCEFCKFMWIAMPDVFEAQP